MSLSKIPKVNVDYGDKIFHLVSYAILSFLWYNTSINQFKFLEKKALVFSCVFSVIFGVVIEIFQSVFTTYRTLDFFDITANALGVLLFAVLLIINKKYLR